MSDPNPYDITLSDQSPMLNYSPYRDGDSMSSGWKVYYTGSSDSSYDSTHKSDNEGSGTSSHCTTMVGATVSLDFYGTGVTVYGSANSGTYSTAIDSESEKSGSVSGSKLFQVSDLEAGKHTLTLKVSDSAGVNVTQAVVTASVGSKGATVVPNTEDAAYRSSDGTTSSNDFFKTNGAQWSTVHSSEKYPRLDTNVVGATASFSFSNASGFIVYGTSNYDHQTFSVSINPSVGATQSERTFNATSRWFSYDNIIFFESGMDPSTTYNVQFKNLAVNNYFDIHSAQLLQTVSNGNSSSSSSSSSSPSSSSTGSTSSSKLSTGAIAGIAVGAALFVIAAIALLLVWRRSKKRKAGSASGFTEDKAVPYNVSPYQHPTPGHSVAPSLSYASSPGPAESRHLLSEYNPYGQPSPGIIPPTKWSQYSEEQRTSGGPSTSYAGSSAGGYAASSVPSESAYYPDNRDASPVPPGSTALSPARLSPASPSGSSQGQVTVSPSGKTTLGPPTTGQRVPRQEVDAGPAPQPAEQEPEEVLPPNYNPAWNS